MVERAGVSISGVEGGWRLASVWREEWWRRSDGVWVVGDGEGGGVVKLTLVEGAEGGETVEGARGPSKETERGPERHFRRRVERGIDVVVVVGERWLLRKAIFLTFNLKMGLMRFSAIYSTSQNRMSEFLQFLVARAGHCMQCIAVLPSTPWPPS